MIGNAQKMRAANKLNRPVGGSRQKPKTPVLGGGNRHRAEPLKLPGTLQAKLTMGKANDAFEQEADRVASEVMRMPRAADDASLDHAGTDRLQRKCSCASQEGGCDKCREERLSLKRCDAGSGGASEIPRSVHEVLSSAGQPLDSATRAFMEPRFGYDFSDVRVHANAIAARSAREVSALAFTVGNHIAFAAGQYVPGTSKTNSLFAHELTHVVQQGGVSGVIQRAGDPTKIPFNFPCDTDLTPGRPPGTDLLFATGKTAIDPSAHDDKLTKFIDAWVAAGGTEDILVHGYSSKPGDEGVNWTLSCQRAQNVRDELVSRGIPRIHIDIVAHGESTDFGAADADNQHAVISTSKAGFFSNPFIFTVLTPNDDFSGRSHSRFGIHEVIKLSFFSIPPRSAADFGGLVWNLVSGGGTLNGITDVGRAIYTAPDTADTVQLDLTISSGVNAGRVVKSRTISIVEPSAVHMVAIPGTAPDHSGQIIPGAWGAGFFANVFVDPTDVSFKGIEFGEGSTTAVVKPPGSFLTPAAGKTHASNTFGQAGAGNSTTGTALTTPDTILGAVVAPMGKSPTGAPTCGASDFLWAVPWEFSVAVGGTRTKFFTANHHMTSNLACDATVEKAGAGPFCRRIDGTTC
jgi:outer membrane protein OmpA-like peptidoglycan-associated protein